MSIKIIIKKNTYVDSVSLMSLSTRANALPGVDQAMVAMGTDMNKEVMRNVGLGAPEINDATTSDLLIVVKAESETACDKAVVDIEELFNKKDDTKDESEVTYATIDSAKNGKPDSNIAIISVNGAFAAREAKKALANDMHVMMFSDNVSVGDEVELKQEAHEKSLLFMGPDCGTAIINGVGLCFANEVRRGNIGIIGASGTGSQEVSVQIHTLGGGITQLIGTGGRDLHEEVGGRMMIDGICALATDENTDVIVLISKPPAKAVEAKVLEEIQAANKPVVVYFIGGEEKVVVNAGGYFASSSKEAAEIAVKLATNIEAKVDQSSLEEAVILEKRTNLSEQERYIRGLFCGGTLCDEALFAAKEIFTDVYSNEDLSDINKSEAHTFIDFGADEFTQGRPHPMIDPSNRIERFLQEARDPEVGVILLDFVLGYGSHSDPVGVMLPAIEEAQALIKDEGRHLQIIAYVLGTELDPTNRDEQIAKLTEAGVTVVHCSTDLGVLAREIVRRGE